MAQIPSDVRKTIPADQLALTLILEGDVGLKVGHISGGLRIPTSTCSNLIDRAVKAGRVERYRDHIDHRDRYVRLTAMGKRERMNARWRKAEGGFS